MKIKNVKKYVTPILLVIIAILFMHGCYKSGKLKTKTEENIVLEKAMNDSIFKYRDKEGVLISKIDVLETTKTSTFLDLKLQKEINKELQQLVAKYENRLGSSGSVTIFKDIIHVDTLIKTQLDTVYQVVDSLIQDTSYTYAFGFNDSWIRIKGITNEKWTNLKLSISNQYSVSILEKKGWKGGYEVLVTNENPHSDVKELKAYKVKGPKKKRFGLGGQIGYGLSIDGTGIVKVTPFVGVGISYNFLKF